MARLLPSLALLALAACAAASERQAEVPPPLSTRGEAPDAVPQEMRRPPTDPGPLVQSAPPEPPRFGRVTVLEDPLPRGLRAAAEPGTPNPSAADGKPFRQRRVIDTGVSHLFVADLSPDERTLVGFSSGERALRLYGVEDGQLRSRAVLDFIEEYGRGDVLFWRRPSELPLVVVGDPHGLSLRDATTGTERSRLATRGAWQLRFSANGEVLMADLPVIPDGAGPGAQRSELAFYRPRPDDSVETELVLRFDERVDAFDLDGRHARLAVLYYPSGDAELIDLAERRVIWTARAPQYAASIDISPDDRLVAVGGDSVVLFDLDDPARSSRFSKLGNNVNTVRFSPSGNLLAVSAYDGRIRTFRPGVETPELSLLQVLRHTGTANVYSLAFSRDGHTLVSSSGDHTLRVWSR